MTWRTLTKIVIIVVTAVLAIYDIIMVSNSERGDTISVVLKDWAGIDNIWVLPFFMSILMGHWFINLWATPLPYGTARSIMLAGIAVATVVLNLTIVRDVPWYVTIPAGLATGAILWAQMKT